MTALSTWQRRSYPPETHEMAAQTANDRFKERNGSRVWAALIMATALHMGVFALWPDLVAQDFSISTSDLEFIELPPEIVIPPPPEAIVRPATPIMASTDISDDITIGVTTIDAYEPDELPPPRGLRETHEGSTIPFFTPMTVRPGIRNRSDVQRALEREYPPLLRDAGIGGTVLVWFFIDETGRVETMRVHTSSGHRALDEAALRVADVIDFTPALNRDRRVPVWISLPITFQIR